MYSDFLQYAFVKLFYILEVKRKGFIKLSKHIHHQNFLSSLLDLSNNFIYKLTFAFIHCYN